MRFYTLAFSVVVHLIAAAVVLVAPLFAIGMLPEPRRAIDYIQVVPPPVPPVAPRRGTATRDRVSADAAPILVPDGITPETGIEAGSTQTGETEGLVEGLPGGDSGGLVIPDEPLPPPAPARVAPVRVGGSVRPPQKIRDAAPVYPAVAAAARVEGMVILEAVIGEDGRVSDVRVLRSTPLLDQAAIDAVRQWQFTPTLLNGQPVPVVMTVTVNFRLQQ